jgi:hypothetical protein
MAFLSRGHMPGEGPYGRHLNAAIDYTLNCQGSRGLIAKRIWDKTTYNHAIGGIMLSEVYGMTDRPRGERIRTAVERALAHTLSIRKPDPTRRGRRAGWRYMSRRPPEDADVLVTAWQLMFLRSARNAGFQIPAEVIDNAMACVKRCYRPASGAFCYQPNGRYCSAATSASGILALSLGGLHNTDMARNAGNWLIAHPLGGYRGAPQKNRYYHYSIYYCSLAMFQLGERYWESFYPAAVRTLLANQRGDGSWPAETGDMLMYGNAYTTALVVQSLAPAYQLVPIYQR